MKYTKENLRLRATIRDESVIILTNPIVTHGVKSAMAVVKMGCDDHLVDLHWLSLDKKWAFSSYENKLKEAGFEGDIPNKEDLPENIDWSSSIKLGDIEATMIELNGFAFPVIRTTQFF